MNAASALPPLFVLHVYPRGMIITRDPMVVERHREEDLLDYGPRDPNGYVKVTPMYVQPRDTAIDFIHTDHIATLLLRPHQSHAHYLSKCQMSCGPVCRIEIAGWIQKRLTKDVAGIIGEYLGGKGWPGQPPFLDYYDLLRAEYCVGHFPCYYQFNCQCYVCR